MKKLLFAALTAVLLGGTALPSQAQAGITAEQRATQLTTQMREQLSLSVTQEPTVAALNLKYAQQMAPLLVGDRRNLAAHRQIRDVQQAKNKDMKAVLSKEQFRQYEKLRDEQRKSFRAASNSSAGPLGQSGPAGRSGRPGQPSREVEMEKSI